MMSCHSITAGQAQSYFEHTTDYYTKNQTNYDRWHGNLAKTMGLSSELSKETFDVAVEEVQKMNRKRAGLDCTFSAPKSVSLALAASPEIRADMIAAHQAAVDRISKHIEMELLQARGREQSQKSYNMLAAEFVHFTARPTKANGYVPDLDLHSHLVILNDTVFDGENKSVDYGKIEKSVKESGLVYRGILAEELQKRGYELELTDDKNGFYELKGFDRETVLEYSHRRREVLETAAEHNMSDMQKANKFSKSSKEKATISEEELIEQTKKDLFDTKKITVQKKKGSFENERHESVEDRREISIHERSRGQRSLAISERTGENPLSQRFASADRLQDLRSRAMDTQAGRAPLLLSTSEIDRLGKLQARSVRDHFMQRAESQERRNRIDRIARAAIKDLSRETYAFSIPQASARIMSAGVLDHVSRDEAERAMERAGIVKLGRIQQPDGRKSRDVYVTTRENIETEKAVLARVGEGKGKITQSVLTLEESRAALDRAEAAARARYEASASFTITDRDGGSGEQAAAVHHILTSKDQFLAVVGLAGTGKTTMCERVKWIADAEGITVRGICFTGKAADGLQQDSGIRSTTIHSFFNALEAGKYNEPTRGENIRTAAAELAKDAAGIHTTHKTPQPDRTKKENLARAAKEAAADMLLSPKDAAAVRHHLEAEDREQAESGGIKQEWDFSAVSKARTREIWLVDEAGLVDMHLMNELQKAALARGAQIVFLGDPDQLPPVGAGEPLRQMEEAGMSIVRLTDIRRQKDLELLAAVRESVSGSTGRAFEKLERRGDYVEIKDADARADAIKAEMTADTPLDRYKESLLLVSTNVQRKSYNERIRQEYVKRGELAAGEKFEITVHGGKKDHREHRQFAEHDRIIFTANDKRAGVMNGTLASIEKIDGTRITARTDAGKKVTFDMKKYNSIDHAYAVTEYKAQGMTVQKVVCEMDTKHRQNRNALYVGISRAKLKARVFTDDKEKLGKQTQEFAKKVIGKDFQDRIDKLRRDGIQTKDLYKAPQEDMQAKLDKALAQIEKHTPTRGARELADSLDRAEREKMQKTAAAAKEKARAAAAEKGKDEGKGHEKTESYTFSR